MEVAPGPATDPLWEASFEAATHAGHCENADSNAASAEGVSWHDTNIVNGRRQTAADAYLAPAAGRGNLKIIAGAHVSRLLIEDATCLGVEYTVGDQTRAAHAGREVILAAGAIGTPHLLLLSGIGPRSSCAASRSTCSQTFRGSAPISTTTPSRRSATPPPGRCALSPGRVNHWCSPEPTPRPHPICR